MPLILVTLLLSETKFLFLDSDTTHTTVKIVHRGITACVIKTSVFVNLVIRERKAQRGYFQHPQTNLYYSAKHKSVARSVALITQRSIKLLTKRRKPLILVSLGPHPVKKNAKWEPLRMWRNWQTRRLQVPVPFGAWRFDSSHPHWTVISYRAWKRRIIQPLSR